ncbi:MAG: hypothetical protein DKM50_13555 [Candidatus Margulisiibacteriota bacterium]|nr:MAG: hypothetical protein DKM50_13555 [Candidatus Margulisiibacteriota bacterium]HAR64399.1 hypothetical protein [Candidatus Margulisiibacteriota bacterium]HCT84820.1 hypothetical protein [Candidatus Margulisiibacteriota bacterium]HCY36708.1 hypothetical protein [Candidatus Margulisiibacteriota bacterium]
MENIDKNKITEFYYCNVCGKVYWKGSHYDHMLDFLKKHIQNIQLRSNT